LRPGVTPPILRGGRAAEGATSGMRRMQAERKSGGRLGTARLAVLCAAGLGTVGWAQCPSSETAAGVDYAEAVQENYDRGMEALAEDDLVEARKYFEQVGRQADPGAGVATLARLRLADCDFQDENFRASATAYRSFVETYPSHEEAEYAKFRLGMSYFRLIPDDLFFMPPSYERDRQAAKDALRELREFVEGVEVRSAGYRPELRERVLGYAEEARARIRDCLTELARGELSVAEFYLNRDEPVAASLRARTVLREYGESGLAPEAMLLLGRIALEAGDRDAARSFFALLVTQYPDSNERERAARYLRFLAGADEEP
jgi:outer membrane protein assembly factor BamD